jgi:hypothetical protein
VNALKRAFATFGLLQGLIALQLYLAHQDSFLTLSQMLKRGIPQGLPLLWHFGIWGDAVAISGLAAFAIGRFSSKWNVWSVSGAFIISLLMTTLMAWVFSWSTTPEAYFHSGWLTHVGIVHLIYMLIVLWIFILLFLFTADLPRRTILIVGILLTVHLLFGTHMVLGILNHVETLAWYPHEPLKSISGWTIITIAIVGLAVRANAASEVGGNSAELSESEKMAQLIAARVEQLPNQSEEARASVYRAARRGLLSQKSQLSSDFEQSEAALEDAIEQVESRFSNRSRLVSWILEITGIQLGTVEGRLKAFDRFCDLLTIGALIKIFNWNLNVSAYFSTGIFDTRNYLNFIRDHALTLALLAAVLAVYDLSRRCVKTELTIVRQLFSPSRMPHNWTYVVGSREIAALILIYLATYLTIAWFVDDIRIVAGLFFVIFVVNHRNMSLSQATLRKYLAEPALVPAASDEHREFILRRREVADDYIFKKPHLIKERFAAAGSAVACVMALVGYAFSHNYLVVMATILMIITLALNELIVFRWRQVRKRKLNAIDQDQATSDRERTGGI